MSTKDRLEEYKKKKKTYGINVPEEQLEQFFEERKKTLSQPKKSTSTKGSASSVSKKKEPSLFDNIRSTLKNAYQAFNPFDDVSFEQAVKNQLNMKVSKGAEEINRIGQRAFDSSLLGLPGELQKKTSGKDAWYRSGRKGLANNILDFASTGVGYLLPGIGAAKGLKAIGLGAKEGTQGLAKLAQLAKEGALTGAGLSAAEVGIREAINPKDYSASDNLKYIGFGTAAGAIGDPLVYGVGKGLSKLFKKPIQEQPYNVLNDPLEQFRKKDYTYNGPTVRGTMEGQSIVNDPIKTLRLNAPEVDNTIKQLGGTVPNDVNLRLGVSPLELPEPLTKRVPKTKLGQDVKIEGTPLLDAPLGGGKPTEYWQTRLKELNDYVNNNQLLKEFNKAVDDQYQYLKTALKNRKGVQQGVIKDQEGYVTGAYRFSENPKWYQDFYRQFGRTPTNEELRQLAREHVLHGFEDDATKIPAWTPRLLEDIDNQIDEITTMMEESPEQTSALTPILKALEQEKEVITRQLDDLRRTKSNEEILQQTWNQMRGDDKVSLNELNQLATPPKEDTSPPLQFKKEKYVPMKEEYPLHYVGRMNPEDMLTQRVEGNFTTKPTDNGVKINARPKEAEEPLRFKKTIEPLRFKKTIIKTQKDTSPIIDLEPIKEARPPLSDKEQAQQLLDNLRSMLRRTKDQQEKEQLRKQIQGLIKFINQEEGKEIYGELDATKLKDITNLEKGTSDVYRNFRKVFGKNFERVRKTILDPLDQAKKEFIDMQEYWLNKLQKEVVERLGIKKGSKLSAYVQKYGEGTLTEAEKASLTPEELVRIKLADQWFRQAYDELLRQVNEARAKIYPNNPDKLVKPRKNYYRHFREMTGLSGLKNLFDSPSQIDPMLAGVSDYTAPKSKWQSFMQKRGKGPYVDDAVGGFLQYIPAASYSTKIDPIIPLFRNLRKQLAMATKDSKNLNNFIEFLYDYANDLAGKTNPFDRSLQKYVPGGRKTMAVLNWVNSRVKKNTVLANASSALAQLANIPNGVAFAKQHSIKGLQRTLESIFNKNAPIYQSAFIKERYADSMYRPFNAKMLEKAEGMAGWLMETFDRLGTSFVWNSVYEKAVKEGIKNPIRYADEETRRLVAGRGVGEVPLLQKSKVIQLVMPFTLEVANLWKVMGDFVKAKDFGGIATLFAANYLFNRVMEEIKGAPVTFDPIDALIDAVTEKDLSPLERVGRVGGEILTNLPLGQSLANIYPEYGEFGPFKGPTREELFGNRNPQRFGTSLLVLEGVSDPFFKLFLPFGGGQAEKTLKGLDALRKEGVYKSPDTWLNLPINNSTKELKYPIKANDENKLKGILFGPPAFEESKEYYDNKRRPLSEKQTKEYHKAKQEGKGNEYYDSLMNERRIKTIERKIKEVKEDKSLSKTERLAKIRLLQGELKKYK